MALGRETFRKTREENPTRYPQDPSYKSQQAGNTTTLYINCKLNSAYLALRDNEDSKAIQHLQATHQPAVPGAPELGTQHGTGRSTNAVSAAHLESLPQFLMALLHSFAR